MSVLVQGPRRDGIPGRMIVDSGPAAAMSRSISAWSTAIGFGQDLWH